MFIGEEKTEELRRIVSEEHGVELTGKEAFALGSQLTSFFEALIYGEEVKHQKSEKDPACNSARSRKRRRI